MGRLPTMPRLLAGLAPDRRTKGEMCPTESTADRSWLAEPQLQWVSQRQEAPECEEDGWPRHEEGKEARRTLEETRCGARRGCGDILHG